MRHVSRFMSSICAFSPVCKPLVNRTGSNSGGSDSLDGSMPGDACASEARRRNAGASKPERVRRPRAGIGARVGLHLPFAQPRQPRLRFLDQDRLHLGRQGGCARCGAHVGRNHHPQRHFLGQSRRRRQRPPGLGIPRPGRAARPSVSSNTWTRRGSAGVSRSRARASRAFRSIAARSACRRPANGGCAASRPPDPVAFCASTGLILLEFLPTKAHICVIRRFLLHHGQANA